MTPVSFDLCSRVSVTLTITIAPKSLITFFQAHVSASRRIRNEQDLAYAESLRIDQAKVSVSFFMPIWYSFHVSVCVIVKEL